MKGLLDAFESFSFSLFAYMKARATSMDGFRNKVCA